MSRRKRNPFFVLYQWLIALPVLMVLTVLTAVLTMILSPLLPNSQISYYPARWWGKLFCWLFFIRVKIRGLENIDMKQSSVIAINHQSMFDIFVVYGWLPSIFKWMMKAELRRLPFVGAACASAGHIFIDRSNPIAAKHSIEKAEKQLTNGVSVVIFPEGTRTRTGQMGKFKKGAFRIATDLQLPIIPATLRGSFERMKRDTFRIYPGTIELIIHPPVETSKYSAEQMQELVDETWKIINNAL